MIDNPHNECIERLIDSLIFTFRIQQDDSLVSVLGSGIEASNQDALRYWIQDILINPDMQIAESILPRLIERLEQALNIAT